ncbi:MAG: fasciclin domain-containing protein [Cyanobacteria bacterium J06641_5]
MTPLSKLTSKFLKVASVGCASLFIALTTTAQSSSAQSITEIAGSSDSFDILVSLLEHAGWLGSFDGTNGKEFTIFAPTDDAFSLLPEGTVESLFKPENREMLYDVLAYHIIGGSVTSGQLSSGAVNSKASGLPLQVNVGQQVTVNNATVTMADIVATNGVIHAIDMVLIPQR